MATEVDWAIIGLGRSGTTSLAAWLDQHPQLQLLYDKARSGIGPRGGVQAGEAGQGETG